MGYKIAVASSDGKIVDLHFRRANQFYIYEVEGESFKLGEIIKITLSGNETLDHDGSILAVVNNLIGNRAVLIAQSGNGAQAILQRQGIDAFNIEDTIEKALDKLIKYYYKIDSRKIK